MISMDTKQVKELTGLTDNQITYLIKKVDALKREKSQGKAREYTFRELVYLKLASLMRSDGLGLDEINQAVGTLNYFWKIKEFTGSGALTKHHEGAWAFSPPSDFLNDGEFLYINANGEVAKKRSLTDHIPGVYYNVMAITKGLSKDDQMELDLMSEEMAVR